jgi:hypothetical protein
MKASPRPGGYTAVSGGPPADRKPLSSWTTKGVPRFSASTTIVRNRDPVVGRITSNCADQTTKPSASTGCCASPTIGSSAATRPWTVPTYREYGTPCRGPRFSTRTTFTAVIPEPPGAGGTADPAGASAAKTEPATAIMSATRTDRRIRPPTRPLP